MMERLRYVCILFLFSWLIFLEMFSTFFGFLEHFCVSSIFFYFIEKALIPRGCCVLSVFVSWQLIKIITCYNFFYVVFYKKKLIIILPLFWGITATDIETYWGHQRPAKYIAYKEVLERYTTKCKVLHLRRFVFIGVSEYLVSLSTWRRGCLL